MAEKVNFIPQAVKDIPKSREFLGAGIDSNLLSYGTPGLLESLLKMDPGFIHQYLYSELMPDEYKTLTREENITVGRLTVYVQEHLRELMKLNNLTVSTWEETKRNPEIKAWYALLSYLGKFMAAGNMGLVRKYIGKMPGLTDTENDDLLNEGYLYLQKVAMNYNPWVNTVKVEDFGKMKTGINFASYAIASLPQLKGDLVYNRGYYTEHENEQISAYLAVEQWLMRESLEGYLSSEIVCGVLAYLKEQKKALENLDRVDWEQIKAKNYDNNIFQSFWKRYGYLFSRKPISLDEERQARVRDNTDYRFHSYTLLETISQTGLNENEVVAEVDDKMRREAIEALLLRLGIFKSERLREIIEMKYGLGRYHGHKPQTYEQIAQYFSLRPDRIKQLHDQAIRILKHPSAARHLRGL